MATLSLCHPNKISKKCQVWSMPKCLMSWFSGDTQREARESSSTVLIKAHCSCIHIETTDLQTANDSILNIHLYSC